MRKVFDLSKTAIKLTNEGNGRDYHEDKQDYCKLLFGNILCQYYTPKEKRWRSF